MYRVWRLAYIVRLAVAPQWRGGGASEVATHHSIDIIVNIT